MARNLASVHSGQCVWCSAAPRQVSRVIMEIALYILFCIVCFAVCTYIVWDDGENITLWHATVILVLSVIPIVNAVVLIFAVAFLVQKISSELKKLNIVLLRGRKKPTKDS